jgi:hypothetical protein
MKLLPILTLLLATSLTPACGVFTQPQPQSPVAVITNAETVARTTLQNAQIAWLFVLPMLTVSHPDKVEELTTKYYDAVQKVSEALDNLNKVKDALTNDVTVKIDLNTALKLESLAIIAVLDVIAEAKTASNKMKATPGSRGLYVPGYDNALAGATQLQSMVK